MIFKYKHSIPTPYANYSGDAVPGRQINTLARHFYLRFTIRALIYSFLFLPMFGLQVTGTFSLSFSLIFIYILIAILILNNLEKFNYPNIFFLVLLYFSGIFAILSSNHWAVSLPSYSLLLVLYFPVFFRMRQTQVAAEAYSLAIGCFLSASRVLAVIGIVQFAAQFLIRSPFIFDISPLFPQFLLTTGNFNTVIDAGGFFKANGLFQREPSGLSGWMAIAIIVEYANRRRIWNLALYSAAILCSFSGTGMLILLFAYLLPMNLKDLLRGIFFLLVGSLVFLIVDTYLVDGYFSGRATEFARVGTSAYARFVAPMQVVLGGMQSTDTLIFGNGPGTYRPSVSVLSAPWEIHDPTWAKLIFEYGLVGTFSAFGFMIAALSSARGPVELKVGYFYAWLASGGQLLAQNFLASIFILLALWSMGKRGRVHDR